MMKTIEHINCHPLNKSKTKQAHCFAKSPRFKQPKTTIKQYQFYDLTQSNCLSNRPKSANFVFGYNSRFREYQTKRIKDRLTPSPNQYQSPGFAQISRKNKKGPSFGHAQRQEKKKQQSPGPCNYNASSYNPESRNKFTIPKQPKISQPARYAHWNRVGPGEYEIGKSNKTLPNVVFPHSSRFNDAKYETPSPCDYQRQQSFTRESFVYSKCPKYSFGKSKRVDINRDHSFSPGPGSYSNDFSQFSERSKRIMNILNRL